MEHFLDMIFEQWLNEQDYNINWFTEIGRDYLNNAEKYLNADEVNKIYDMLCDNGEETWRNAFKAGFGYAFTCLSNECIQLGGANNEQ